MTKIAAQKQQILDLLGRFKENTGRRPDAGVGHPSRPTLRLVGEVAPAPPPAPGTPAKAASPERAAAPRPRPAAPSASAGLARARRLEQRLDHQRQAVRRLLTPIPDDLPRAAGRRLRFSSPARVASPAEDGPVAPADAVGSREPGRQVRPNTSPRRDRPAPGASRRPEGKPRPAVPRRPEGKPRPAVPRRPEGKPHSAAPRRPAQLDHERLDTLVLQGLMAYCLLLLIW